MKSDSGFWQLVGAQQAKLLRQPLLWIELGLLMVLIVILSIVPRLIATPSPEDGPALSADLGAELLMASQTAGDSGLGGLLMIILAGAVMAREYEWRTLHHWLSRGVSRRRFLWSSFVSLLGPTLLIPFVAVLAAIPGTAYFIHVIHGRVELTTTTLLEVLVSIPLAGYAILPYVAIAIFLAVWGRSQFVAIGGGLALALVLESLLVQILGSAGGLWLVIARYLPASLGSSLLIGEGGFVPPVAEGAAITFILLYLVVLVGASSALLTRQDLSE